MTSNVTRLRPTKPCPICGKPSVQAFHPFCSGRCADVDLNRWLTGSYVIPAEIDAVSDEDNTLPPPPSGDDEDDNI